jgi:glutamine synthetase
MTPEKILKKVKDENIKFIDLKFNDLPGLWQHFTITAGELNGNLDSDPSKGGIWAEGIGFDGSSIRGFQHIQESDMILMLDPGTAIIDPIPQHPTLSIICDVYNPVTKKPYTRDPRYIAKKAVKYLKSTGLADTCYCGPEQEFFIFDDIRFDQDQRSGYYYIDSIEADWNTGRDEKPNLGYKPRYKEGYFPVAPHDSLQDLRSEIVETMVAAGLEIEVHHHEVATAGQCEIDSQGPAQMGDQMMWFKYVIKNVCHKHNKVAFVPKPIFRIRPACTFIRACSKMVKICFRPRYALIANLQIRIGLSNSRSLIRHMLSTTSSYKRLVPS